MNQRRNSRYHGCLSFLEYTGYDMATDTYSYGGNELAHATPGEMQANFMSQRWGNRGKENPVAVFGPGGQSGEQKPIDPPLAPHQHDYRDKPEDIDGRLGFRCTDSKCDHIWWVDSK